MLPWVGRHVAHPPEVVPIEDLAQVLEDKQHREDRQASEDRHGVGEYNVPSMPTLAATDTSVRVTRPLFELAARSAGEAPLAWGRYFNGFHTTAAEYQPVEAGFFEALGLKLLPVAQQTPKVNRTQADGAANAALNIYKFISRIGLDVLAAQGNEFLMFLDVEGEPTGSNPSMSADYYLGWSKTLVASSREQSGNRITIVPAIYARAKDDVTWNALIDAQNRGAEPCRGVWITRQHIDACTKPRPQWEKAFITPGPAIGCPVMVWQYAIDCPDGNGVDLDLINPDATAQKALLDRLVTPAVT